MESARVRYLRTSCWRIKALSKKNSLTKQGNVWKLEANNFKKKAKDVNQTELKHWLMKR